MTPTRALVGVAAAAVAGYVVIHSLSNEGPQYLGDFPSILEQAQAEPGVVPSGMTPGEPLPDPPHFDAQPVTPEAPAAPPAGPAGPGSIGPAAPPGGGGTGGQGGYPQPGVPGPPDIPLPSFTDFLAGLPPIDAAQVCRDTAGSIIALVPCDDIPELPPVDPPDLPDLPVG
jgi:hypothetical protein